MRYAIASRLKRTGTAFPLYKKERERRSRPTRTLSWATPSAYEKQNDGEPGQTAGVPVIIKVIDLMPCREAGGGGGDGRILLMFRTASDLQPGTLELSDRSAEVVETLHRR